MQFAAEDSARNKKPDLWRKSGLSIGLAAAYFSMGTSIRLPHSVHEPS
jgi:hypothetical protein